MHVTLALKDSVCAARAVLCTSPVMNAGVPVLWAGWDRSLGARETDK